jgi:hypothetical protein
VAIDKGKLIGIVIQLTLPTKINPTLLKTLAKKQASDLV